MLEPIMFPREISLLPAIPAAMLTDASGALVPIATTVRPITTDGIFSICAIEDAPSTKKSAPFINKTKPKINNTYIIYKTSF